MRYLPLIAALALPATPLHAEEIPASGLDNLPQAQVILIGEVHDNVTHHLNQARAVAAIRPSALVFEMLPPGPLVTEGLRMKAATLAGDAAWTEAHWGSFPALYSPILEAAPEAQLYGALADADARRLARQEGVAAGFGADAEDYGLDIALPAQLQAEWEQEQADAHCGALPEDALAGMVEVQRLRDGLLAREAWRALAETGGPVVVITGGGHARKTAVPLLLARAAPELRQLVIGQYEAGAVPQVPPYDLWLVTEAQEREDPCAAFAQPKG